MEFKISSAKPLVSAGNIYWQFNGMILESSNRLEFSDSKLSLQIYNLTLSDEGNYTLVASNPAGVGSAYIFLNVEGNQVANQYETDLLYAQTKKVLY